MDGKKQHKGDDPLRRHQEWQDNQYDPGHWMGGNIPPYVGVPDKTSLFGKLYKIGAKFVGIFYVLMGLMLFGTAYQIWGWLFEYPPTTSDLIGTLGCIIFIAGLGLLGILYGLKYLKVGRRERKG